MHTFNLRFRKYILLWAFLAMVLGYFIGRFNHERVIGLKFLVTPLLFTMIFLMVFPVKMSSLLKLRLYSSQIIASYVLTVLSPVLALIVSKIIPQQFVFLSTGIVISSTVPPDAMLSAWAAFLEGDVLFTLIIQSFTFIYYLFLVPFGLTLLFEGLTDFSLFLLIKNLLFLIVMPFVLAGILRFLLRKYVTKDVLSFIKPTLSTISGIIELFVILISIALWEQIITENPGVILWGVFTASLYYATALTAAYFMIKVFDLDYQTSVGLLFQNGTKNLPVAMVITLSTFRSQAMLGVAACVLVQFPISALFFSVIRKIISKREEVIVVSDS
jgi:ACR3 family arsenite efflux pump ArsB